MREEGATSRTPRRRTGPTGTVVPPPVAPPSAVPTAASFVATDPSPKRGTARAVDPLVDAMHVISSELLSLASHLALGVVPTNGRVLREHIATLFAEMRTRAQTMNVPEEDVAHAQFAIVALLDEILVQLNWPGRAEWQTSPLQFVYFNQNAAGETFFRIAHMLLGQPHRAHVLLIYHYCLALGFQGRHAVNAGAELAYLVRGMANALEGHLMPPDPLSPHGVPEEQDRSVLRREAPLIRASLVVLSVSLLLFVILEIALSMNVTSTLAKMHVPAPSAQRGM